MKDIRLSEERFFISPKNWELYCQHMGRYLFARQPVRRGLVLDAACGSGYGTAILAEKAYMAVGIDISREAIDYCKKKYQSSKIQFLIMDCVNLGFPNEQFDIAVSFETVEHIRRPEKFIQELHRVLKPDGHLIISTPNRDLYRIYNKGQTNRYHTHEFDEHGFRKLMGSYFEIEQIHGQRYFSKKDVPLLASYTTKQIPVGPDGVFRKLVRIGIRTVLPDGPLRSKLRSYEIWANKCKVGNIIPSKAIYLVGIMRKKS